MDQLKKRMSRTAVLYQLKKHETMYSAIQPGS